MVEPDERSPGLDQVNVVLPDAEGLLVAEQQRKKGQK